MEAKILVLAVISLLLVAEQCKGNCNPFKRDTLNLFNLNYLMFSLHALPHVSRSILVVRTN